MKARFITGLLSALAIAGSAAAATFRVASAGDVNSMDPHALNEVTQISVMGNVYEPLVTRDRHYRLAPALATGWKRTAPTLWRFSLRRGVRFHDGTAFSADDVIFSWQRAAGEGSDVKVYVGSIKAIRKLGEFEIEIETTAPNPILPEQIVPFFIMNRAWCEQQGATRPVDRRKGIENSASFRANGTGPFRLRERQPGTRTTFVRHASWWGRVEGNVDEVVFTPIVADNTRTSALLSGEVDLADPLAPNDVDGVRKAPAFEVVMAPENRVSFLGFDQRRDDLAGARNPFKDRRVRQAVWQAIDTDTLVRVALRGAATPRALPVTPQMRGYDAALDKRPPYDPEAARRLLAEAGYPSGFKTPFSCQQERLGLCQAIAAYLARVGIAAELDTAPRAIWLPRYLRRELPFYLQSAGTPTADAHYTLNILMASAGEGGRGVFNAGGWANPQVDTLTAAVGTEMDETRRQTLISEALRIHRDEVGHVPLFQHSMIRGVRRGTSLVQWPDTLLRWHYVVVAPPR